ncbi:MAG: SRPBCC family protein [Alphaproteobacteria bacterium]|nr:SRPBCC family protein [Alphaproteobacteria bacterium]
MFQVQSSVCIDASPERVWRYLSDVENITAWAPAIKQARCESDQSRGVGTVRICKLDRFDVREEFIAWDEGRGLAYRARGAPMIETATNHWSIEVMGDQTLLTSRTEIELKGGVFGRLLEPLMKLAVRFGFPNALAPLKYYIETGQPFAGKATNLPKAPTYC